MSVITAETYGELCDVIERNYHGWPLDRQDDEPDVLHTSKEARAAATRILGILGLEVEDPTAGYTPEQLRSIAAKLKSRTGRPER